MKLSYGTKKNNTEEIIMREHLEHKHIVHESEGRVHIPPHERKNLLQLQFDEKDMHLFEKIFGDEDTAYAAADIISNAPPEIKILSIQLLKMIEEVEVA